METEHILPITPHFFSCVGYGAIYHHIGKNQAQILAKQVWRIYTEEQTMKARLLALKIVIAALALTAPSLWAQDGLEGVLSRASVGSPANLGTCRQTLAAADFDGDNKADGAVLVDCGWLGPQSVRTIELHFTGRGNAELTFESAETALEISALDVNSDGATDIVVEQAFTHKRLQVWLNDGRGGFRKARVEDFQFADAGGRERVESPSQWDCPTAGLPSQRGSEFAILTVFPLLGGSAVACHQALLPEPAIRSCKVSSSSPRAPPLSPSL